MNRIKRFLPGDGQSPPHLAGREAEQTILREFLGWLQERGDIPSDVTLLGPRGNGKTVLLRWLEREALATNKVDVAWLTPDELPDLDKLANALVPPGRFASLLSRMGWKPGGHPGILSDLLEARCARKPLLVLLDEAHTLDKDLGRALLNASQEVRAKAPFLLVQAGTPGLREHLGSLGLSFADRDKRLDLRRLTREALDLVVTESQSPVIQKNPTRPRPGGVDHRSWVGCCNVSVFNHGRYLHALPPFHESLLDIGVRVQNPGADTADAPAPSPTRPTHPFPHRSLFRMPALGGLS